MNPPLFLQASGMINALGQPHQTIWYNLTNGIQTCLSPCDQLINGRSTWVGRVQNELPAIPGVFKEYACRNNQLLLAAYQQIQAEVDEAIVMYGRHRIAVVAGSSTSGILEGEMALESKEKTGRFPDSFNYCQQEMGTVAEFLARYAGLTGLAYTISTACSSSARAFIAARNLIRMDLADAVIVGGVDSLCQLTLNGFSALELISDDFCNPFSKNRKGINIGEGAALFLLTKQKSEIQLLGSGESSDAYHTSAPHPDGKGAIQAMQQALKSADLTTVDYVNLHGTGTFQNDAMECVAMKDVFPQGVFCSSTKPLTGHLLGASGATEIGFCWLALSSCNPQNLLPPHVWDSESDENLPRLNLVTPLQNAPLRVCMSNSFGFGGNNVSVIIGKAK
ncbi:MAG TPA: beta-ketoacyl-[acyl-carrier-protein] synthase family protein [Thermodesulfovibrionia bacterium]|nr:beta-ketoacyl-[acyl-carrier-protein] synthase family protein [Thermodesulfovibrionia bacterium]